MCVRAMHCVWFVNLLPLIGDLAHILSFLWGMAWMLAAFVSPVEPLRWTNHALVFVDSTESRCRDACVWTAMGRRECLSHGGVWHVFALERIQIRVCWNRRHWIIELVFFNEASFCTYWLHVEPSVQWDLLFYTCEETCMKFFDWELICLCWSWLMTWV